LTFFLGCAFSDCAGAPSEVRVSLLLVLFSTVRMLCKHVRTKHGTGDHEAASCLAVAVEIWLLLIALGAVQDVQRSGLVLPSMLSPRANQPQFDVKDGVVNDSRTSAEIAHAERRSAERCGEAKLAEHALGLFIVVNFPVHFPWAVVDGLFPSVLFSMAMMLKNSAEKSLCQSLLLQCILQLVLETPFEILLQERQKITSTASCLPDEVRQVLSQRYADL
jgi:hypothetical protein